MTSEPFPEINRNAYCASPRCSQTPHDNLPLCEDHAWDVWAAMNAHRESLAEMAAAEERRRQWLEELATKDQAKLAALKAGTANSEPGTIYYLQVADQIKIGYTTNLDVRLKSYPPVARLRATHPGTLQTEASMHKRFSDDIAAGREWFKVSREIESHIEVVREKFKQDARVI